MSDFATSLIRTITPMIVGYVLAALASAGVKLDDAAAANLGAFMAALFSALYYAVVRIIEKTHPQAGLLLGSVKKVTYMEPKK
jgi:hypothetical protein